MSRRRNSTRGDLILLPWWFTVIEQNEREIDAALKRSEALRQSILKRAFSGQLVPQDRTDFRTPRPHPSRTR